MRFEEVLDGVGGFSRFQLLLLFILCVPRAILPLHFLLPNFISATPPHRCALGSPEDAEPGAPALWIPRQDDGSLSSCSVYEAAPASELDRGNATAPCSHGWIYNESRAHSTTASEVSGSAGPAGPGR